MVFCLLLFAYWTFPYDRVRDFIIQEVENPRGPGDRRRPSGYQLEIVDLSPSWVTGVELTGVRLVKLPEEPEERPVDVTFEEVNARVGLLALLTGRTDLSFDLRVAGGTIAGELQQSEDETHVAAQIENVNLRRLGILRGYFSLPLQGMVSGDIDLTVASEAENTNGSVDLRIAGLKVGDGNAKLKIGDMRDGVTVEQIDAGNVALVAEVEEGVLSIERLQGRGPDLELDGAGDVRLVQPMERSRVNVLVRLAFSDEFKERSDRTRALFSLLDLQPRARAAKTDDGAIQLRLAGSFGNLNARPAGREPAP